MPKNPFEEFRQVFDADTLIDIAFRKGESKAASIPTRATKIMKAKRKEVNRVKNVNKYILDQIKKIVQSVPNLDELHAFYQELSHLIVNKDEFKRNLGKINGLIPVYQKLQSEMIRRINDAETPKQCAAIRRQYYARAHSIMKKQRTTLAYLEKSRKELFIIPTIDTSLPSIVIAGYPNVGKSSLVSRLSSAHPEICEYPFTTKKIIIGLYRDSEKTKMFQVIDTPGVLDRPMSERNTIEKQSILALRTVSNIVAFMFDPTPSCGFSVDNQIALFKEIKEHFIDVVKVPWLVLLNKKDFATEEEKGYIINTLGLKEENILETNAKDGDLKPFVNKMMKIIIDKDLMPLDLSEFE